MKLNNKQKRIYILFFISQVIANTSIINPIRFAYMQMFGSDISIIGSLKFVFLFTMFIFEIPTGYIADRFGQKISIQISYALLALYFLIVIGIPNSFGFLFSQVVLGLSTCFASGATDIYLKDMLYQIDSKDKTAYLKAISHLGIAGKIFSTFAALLVGFLYTYSKEMPFVISTLFCTCSFLILFLLPKSKIDKKITFNMKTFFKEFTSDIFMTFKSVFADKTILRLVLVDSFFTAGIVYILESFQFKFSSIGIDVQYFGLIYAFGGVAAIIGQFLVSNIKQAYGNDFHKEFVSLIFFVICGGILLFAFSVNIFMLLPSIAILSGAYSIWLLAINNKTMQYTNGIKNRSTFISTYSQGVALFRAVFALLFTFLLLYVDFTFMACLLAGALFLIAIKAFWVPKGTKI